MMKDKLSLHDYITADRMDYFPSLSKGYLVDWLLKSEQYWLRTFVKYLRKEEYFTFYRPNWILKYYYKRKKNILGRKLSFFINAGNFGQGLKISHYGSIIVHPNARIGNNCTLHGNCCIGSKGSLPDVAPIVGDNVDIGQGAQILGDIIIADGVKIGAGSIVVKSVLETNVTVAGVPARIINNDNIIE